MTRAFLVYKFKISVTIDNDYHYINKGVNMKKYLYLVLSAVLLVSFIGCKSQGDKPVQESETKEAEEVEIVEEDTEDSEKEYTRIIAGTVAVSEVLDVLQVDEVVGVPTTAYALPERYQGLTEIGRPMEPDMEIVKSLDPDLFVSVESVIEANEPKLQQNNIPYLFISLDSIESIKNSIETLGTEIGKADFAKEITSNMDAKIDEIVKKTEGKESPRVLFLFGSPRAISVGTPNSYVGSLLEKLNVNNISDEIVEGEPKSYMPLNLENIVVADPDLIIRMTHAAPEKSQAMLDKEFSENDIWKNLRAVQEEKVVDLELDLFSVSGSVNVVDAIEKLYEHVYER